MKSRQLQFCKSLRHKDLAAITPGTVFALSSAGDTDSPLHVTVTNAMKSFDTIKKSSLKVRWNLREVHKITQWKDGCVYRTRSLGIISCSPEYATYLRSNPDIIVGPISTSVSKIVNA